MERTQINTPKIVICGLLIHKITMTGLLDYCEKAIKKRSLLVLGMVNVAKLVNSRKDYRLREGISGADLVAADGQGIIWLSRLSGNSLPERVTGIDVMYNLLDLANLNRYRIFFLGAKPEVVQRVVDKVELSYQNIKIAGYADGYFDLDKDGQKIAEKISDSNADILFVAISPPKKEIFIDKWRDKMSVPVCHGVGGSFDVFAGMTKRAPIWMQKAGLEWFFRVMQEPKRMWKRYLITNTLFLFLSFREIVINRLGIQKKESFN